MQELSQGGEEEEDEEEVNVRRAAKTSQASIPSSNRLQRQEREEEERRKEREEEAVRAERVRRENEREEERRREETERPNAEVGEPQVVSSSSPRQVSNTGLKFEVLSPGQDQVSSHLSGSSGQVQVEKSPVCDESSLYFRSSVKTKKYPTPSQVFIYNIFNLEVVLY